MINCWLYHRGASKGLLRPFHQPAGPRRLAAPARAPASGGRSRARARGQVRRRRVGVRRRPAARSRQVFGRSSRRGSKAARAGLTIRPPARSRPGKRWQGARPAASVCGRWPPCGPRQWRGGRGKAGVRPCAIGWRPPFPTIRPMPAISSCRRISRLCAWHATRMPEGARPRRLSGGVLHPNAVLLPGRRRLPGHRSVLRSGRGAAAAAGALHLPSPS